VLKGVGLCSRERDNLAEEGVEEEENVRGGMKNVRERHRAKRIGCVRGRADDISLTKTPGYRYETNG
jgi:hypothetical protein